MKSRFEREVERLVVQAGTTCSGFVWVHTECEQGLAQFEFAVDGEVACILHSSPRERQRMAQRTQVVLIDDLDGNEIKDGGQSISFSFNGTDYSIDLSGTNAGKFEQAVSPYIEHAQRVGGRRSSNRGGSAASKPTGTVDSKAVRAWAQSNGIELSSRGRIPADVVEKYQAAQN